MKNFTNNFKQFTSRLSARWLIMALMLLVGTSSAWAYDQSAVDLYFDNSESKWTNCYVYIGHKNGNGWLAFYSMSRVSGTQYLWQLKKANFNSGNTWGGAAHWGVTNNSWTAQAQSVDKIVWMGDNNFTYDNGSTIDEKAWEATNIYKAYESKSVSLDGQSKKAYQLSSSTKSNYTVTINSATGGTLTVKDYDNATVSSGASKIKLTVLKFTASASTGYSLQEVQINDGSTTTTIAAANLGSTTYTLKSAVTITPVWELDCPAPEMPTATVEKHTTKCSGTDRNQGVIKLTNYNSAYTYKLGNGTVSVSSDGKMSGLPEGKYYITAVSSCGAETKTTSTFDVNVTDVTPVATVKVTGDNEICSGETTTLTATVTATLGTVSSYSWSPNDGTKDGNKYTTPALTKTTSYLAQAKLTNDNCEKTVSATAYTITVKTAPEKPAVTLLPAEGNIISGNKATLSVSSPVNGATYTLYEETRGKIEEGKTSFEITEAGTYYVKGANDCGESPASENKTITVCTPNATLLSATYNQQTDKIDLSGNLTETCGKTIYYGFLWKVKGDDWNTNNAISGTGNSYNSTSTNNTAFNQSWADAEDGTTYVFTAYALNTATNPHTWYYDETGIEVSKCITVATPNVTAAPVCAGNEAVLTLNSRQNGVTYKLGNTEIFTSGNTHTVTPEKTTTYTITATSAISCVANQKASTDVEVKVIEHPEAPKFTSSSTTICEGETIELPTPTNIGSYEIAWSIKDAKNTPVPVTLTETTIFCAVLSNNGCLSTATEFTVNVTPIPTISGATFTQPGKDNAIELTVPTGNDTKWTVNNNGDLSVATGSSTMFSAENEDTYTITADNKGCTDTHVVTVSDAFYVYMRQPKKGETAYNNFYYPTQNPTQGGDLFYKEYASIPPAEGYTDYNQGGRAHDVILTDCDGYVWYGFKASAQLIDGTNYFTVHAPNKNGYDGWFTHTDITKPGKMTGDIYYIMGTEGNGNSGWKIEEVSAPYSGPKVHASGNDFSFNKNNFADFVALYVTDCSGKEVKSYQWQYSATENGNYDNYSSVCTYVGKKSEQGDAGKTNNIRPNVAGWYRCTATYKDGSTLTSAAKQVTATSGTSYSFTSDLPIIMVNTNGYGFPSCDGLSGTASKNAEVMKEKRSVDVKITLNGNVVYDRKARMNYRGSSSLNFVKKSYAFCPGKADCVEDKGRVDYVKTEKLNMLNVGSAVDKDWVLYAAAADPSIMRNRLMFDTFRDMTGSWSVQSRYVELIVDGEYKGIYVFMDKITNNANRVNITDENGFILKFDKTDIVDRYEGSGDKKTFKSLYSGKDGSGTYDTQIDQRFEIEYPEMEDVEEEEAGKWATTVNNIKSMINNFETQLKAGNYAEVQKIIDYKSWADWFIITEYAKNMDAYRASCMFVYNGDKLEARPLWDQELSFKNYCATLCDDYSCDNAEGLLIRTSKIYEDTESCSAPFWFTGKYVQGRGTEAIGGSQQFVGYLLNDPCFVQTVKDRWNEHKNKALSAESLNAKLERYTNEMATALDREKSIWKSEGGKLSRETCQCSYNGTTGYSDIKISDSKGDITEWINARPSELEEALNAEIGTGLSISFSEENINTTPWEPVVLQVHNESGYHYTLTYTDNALDQLAGIIIEKNGDTYKYNIPRPANWGTGDEATEGERANIVYGLKATLQMDSSNVVCGSQAEVPFDEATITLQDEPNENCPQP